MNNFDIKGIKPYVASARSAIKLKTVFVSTDFIILEKPAGLLVHPVRRLNEGDLPTKENLLTEINGTLPGNNFSNGVHPDQHHHEKTLIDLVLASYPEIETVGDHPPVGGRPGIVHRLDKDVSGLMVVARSQKFYEHIVQQFTEDVATYGEAGRGSSGVRRSQSVNFIKNREMSSAFSPREEVEIQSAKAGRVKKEYLALVYGRPDPSAGRIDLPLARTKDGKIVAVQYHGKIKNQKEAVTEYETIKNYSQYSLLKVRPLTGRTNQIRVHLRAINCPIVGDLIYGFKDKTEGDELGRIFLHAAYLGFYDLNNAWQEFRSDLPEVLVNFLNNLR